jgi:PAS domain S-box-containing protein
MRTDRNHNVEQFIAFAREVAKRFESDASRLALRVRELGARWAGLRAELIALGASESVLAEIEARDAEIALAETQNREIGEAFVAAIDRLEVETAGARGTQKDEQPCIVTDRAGSIVQANPAAATLLAIGPEAMRGKLLIAFVARQDTRAFRTRLRALDPNDEVASFEVRLRPRGGTPFSARLSVDPVPSEAGLRWTISVVRAGRSSVEPLEERMRRALEELSTTFAAIQASARALREGAKDASASAQTIEAMTAAAARPSKPLEELERMVSEVYDKLAH